MNWQVSELVNAEVSLFFKAVLLGIRIIFLYDLLRIFRRVILHNMLGEMVEDFFYWIILGYKVYLLLMKENAGGLRFYIVLGIGIGGVVYWCSAGRYFVKYSSEFLIRGKQRMGNLYLKGKRKVEIPAIKMKNRYQTFRNWADKKRKRRLQQMRKKWMQYCKMMKITFTKQ